MRRKGLFWRIYLYFLVITAGVVVGAAWYGARVLRQFHQEQAAADLQARAQIMARELSLPLDGDAAALDRLCKDLGRRTLSRITVVLPNGRVIADSDEDPAVMDNHAKRPEIAAALAGKIAQSIRYSDTLRRNLMYLAVPLRQNGVIAGVVRTSMPLAQIDEPLVTLLRHVALAGAGVAAAFLLLALYLSRRITRPLMHMRQAAEQFAEGDLTARIPVPDTVELAVLARTMNEMAVQLNDRLRTIAVQSNEQNAVFDSMVEGVVAVDRKERILHINPAAARLLGVTPEATQGRHILEVVRNIELQEFLGQTLTADGLMEREIVLRGDNEQFIQLHGTALKDAAGAPIGVLAVMNDITRLKRLENVRRDFVANVSHELKTPLTTIKGCVETLSAGALRDPEQSVRFLEMMSRHVDRLELMVDDLLALSRIEHDGERGRIVLAPGAIRDVLTRVQQTFAARAEAKAVAVIVECPEALQAPIDAALLEQAVGNLLDNAIKYSPERTRISVTAAGIEGAVEIRVADQGPGIEKPHLDRIFERFYRVDPARARALGGTGLGLAIVKHIALAHRGSVTVESAPGRGSVFILRLPRA
jgi:two-component system phosphate regulon sensor histidine kinase PhoR